MNQRSCAVLAKETSRDYPKLTCQIDSQPGLHPAPPSPVAVSKLRMKLVQEKETHCEPRAGVATAVRHPADAVRATGVNVAPAEGVVQIMAGHRPATRKSEPMVLLVVGYSRHAHVCRSIRRFVSRARQFSCTTTSGLSSKMADMETQRTLSYCSSETWDLPCREGHVWHISYILCQGRCSSHTVPKTVKPVAKDIAPHLETVHYRRLSTRGRAYFVLSTSRAGNPPRRTHNRG